MTLTLQLPIPDKILFANGQNQSRGAGFLRRQAKKIHRERARGEAVRVLADAGISPPNWLKARYRVTYFHLKGPVRDPDNLMAAMKAYTDGACDAGIVKNDRHLFPERPIYKLVDRMPRVEILIEEEV